MKKKTKDSKKVKLDSGCNCHTLAKTDKKHPKVCLIAPKSLERPIQYRQFPDKKFPASLLPVSKVCGELREVTKPDNCARPGCEDPCCKPESPCTNATCGNKDSTKLPVYFEHGGRFMKAPQFLLDGGDFKTRTCYLQTTDGVTLKTPLDFAIAFQKMFTISAKIMMGILAGVVLMELILVERLMSEGKFSGLVLFFSSYAAICDIFFVLKSVFLIVVLVASFDWLDLEHMNLQHAYDTFSLRAVWVVSVLVALSFFMFTMNCAVSDAIYLRGFYERWITDDNPYIPQELQLNKVFWENIEIWQNRLFWYNSGLIASWCILVVTSNDDLFLTHLQFMKKYDPLSEVTKV